MNIGIVTIFGEWNYGNRLQNYALQTVIEFLGNTCSTIVVDQNGESDIHRRLAMAVCHAVKKNSYLRRKRCYNFYKFNEKYINQNHYTASSLPLVANDTFDYVVCGSDQVWNLKLGDIKSNPDLYFLSFIERKRRVSYAASIGTDFVPPEHRDYFVSKIKGIPSISVRENSARDIIKELTSRDVDVVIDPTLLLSQKQWSDLAQKPKNFTDKNIWQHISSVIPTVKQTIISAKSPKITTCKLCRFCPIIPTSAVIFQHIHILRVSFCMFFKMPSSSQRIPFTAVSFQ